MTKDTYLILTDLLGDNHSEFVAMSLKDSYQNLIAALTDPKELPAITSDNPVEEAEFIIERLKAFELAYNWYATDNIKD